MGYIAIISLILGFIVGNLFGEYDFWKLFIEYSHLFLWGLMLSVGISIGMHQGVFSKVKGYGSKIILLPIGTLIGTLIGGYIASYILKIPVNYGLSIASGMGWYSLLGVMITDIIGSKYGTIGFLSNLLRELLSFLLIPLGVKYFNKYAAIALGGATSEDTTLPMLIKYSDEETVVLAVFHGITCSLMVPILLKFFLA